MKAPALVRLRRLFSGLGVLAVLANGFMPAVSKVIAAGVVQQRGWIEVCSYGGSHWVRVDGQARIVEESGPRPADAPASSHDDACPYCVGHAGNAPLPALKAAFAPRPIAFASCARLPSEESALACRFSPWSWPSLRGPPFRV